jgi:hypothetical protein
MDVYIYFFAHLERRLFIEHPTNPIHSAKVRRYAAEIVSSIS